MILGQPMHLQDLTGTLSLRLTGWNGSTKATSMCFNIKRQTYLKICYKKKLPKCTGGKENQQSMCRFFVLEDRSATQKSETKGSKNWKALDNCVLWPWRTPHPRTDWKAFRQQVLSAGKATSSGSLRDICWWHLWCESAAVCTWVTRVRCGR